MGDSVLDCLGAADAQVVHGVTVVEAGPDEGSLCVGGNSPDARQYRSDQKRQEGVGGCRVVAKGFSGP
jgi:hypothetical protein